MYFHFTNQVRSITKRKFKQLHSEGELRGRHIHSVPEAVWRQNPGNYCNVPSSGDAYYHAPISPSLNPSPLRPVRLETGSWTELRGAMCRYFIGVGEYEFNTNTTRYATMPFYTLLRATPNVLVGSEGTRRIHTDFTNVASDGEDRGFQDYLRTIGSTPAWWRTYEELRDGVHRTSDVRGSLLISSVLPTSPV